MTADAIHVRDGEVWSSAGVTAGIDLCLALVEEDRGPDAARAVARARLFREQVGATPAACVERVRVEAARMLLEGGSSVTGAAARSGLGSDESLRRAFARHFGVTPSAYLARFRTTTGASSG